MIALFAVLVLAEPTPIRIAGGIAASALGLLVRAWASGHIRKEKKLAVTGPYRFSRNPLYLGNFILGLGIAWGTRSWWCLGIFLGYFLFFYPAVILEEHERMRCLFPADYAAYHKRVPTFFPTFKPFPSTDGSCWSLSLYKKNGEYRALLGTVTVWAIFVAKWWAWR
jgi:protein-S-isoprenylcysteine O-methyltransferase Ste14